ncbi:hypothetical protein A2767_03725 [Candidatus Roizmanbacteria bacterium RIFCSPHIGHO2_01_FULL_35_10]|uniref:MurNAc-LAA domain-containing protein n=1 Tax=Candidatus Roizmanbacteria bacterium RIFCSPLOWO2_01_FULL_35_13 TaxID=1802055 RepID=A0A1F7IA44_9BACT|nr:MAG: hypothetical protein A2767_03725 [Candidatus Roizmanbacteria bacterium RIFCSPHIGHO2_01_FULL_35_10]OGK40234.1 MAG: hypothetical protein A3A74_07040 [Candidatus Roizmanbacteria bacterium RIFCSPLOWO2_01_FULL_35_13]
MRRSLLIFFITLSAILFFIPKITYSLETAVTGHKIILDAGHGGDDYGSTACYGLPEKEVNLQITNKLKTLLETDAAKVLMTRSDDSTHSNNYRYTFANSNGGEVLVSIHLNGSSNVFTDGTLGLYGKIGKDKAFTQVLHNALWVGLNYTPNFIDFGVTNFASGVLLKSTMSATIQETVFISNNYECDLLNNSGGERQQQIAQSLYNGLINWFSQPQSTPTPKPGKNKQTLN